VSLDHDKVVEFLRNHPTFFEQHPELVRDIKIPTDSGVAISLAEFQIRRLRDQVAQLERENDYMIETARINSVLFERTRSLVLALLDAQDLEDVSVALDEKLSQGFDIPVVRLLLSDQFNVPEGLPLIAPIQRAVLEEGGALAQAISNRTPWIGRLTKERRGTLFGEVTTLTESCATLGLIKGHSYGVLALGHPDATHFQSNQDTLFLDHIGEALAMILPRLVQPVD